MIDGKQPFDLQEGAGRTSRPYDKRRQDAATCSRPPPRTATRPRLPAIWENKADFDAKLAKFSADAKAAAARSPTSTLKAEVGEVGKNCGGCHKTIARSPDRPRLADRQNFRAACPQDAPPSAFRGGASRHRIGRRRRRCCANFSSWPLPPAIVGLVVFWVVTIPATVPASALAPHTPNLDNGKTMFYAGGCASCHATPGQDDKTRLGGGFGAEVAVRHVLCAQHLARPNGRHRPVERGQFRHRHGEGHLARRPASLIRRFPTRRISA